MSTSTEPSIPFDSWRNADICAMDKGSVSGNSTHRTASEHGGVVNEPIEGKEVIKDVTCIYYQLCDNSTTWENYSDKSFVYICEGNEVDHYLKYLIGTSKWGIKMTVPDILWLRR